jgi:type IV pilus assembly protein PilV
MLIRNQGGSGLIEVLVSLVVIGIGLLGILELYAAGQRSELEAYQRAQALVLAEDMANRINTNREATDCYTINNSDATDFLGQGNTETYQCSGVGTQATRALADDDLAAWDNLLKGTTETNGDGSVNFGGLVDARGCISSNAAGDIITIAVAWTGSSKLSDAAHTCAEDEYDAADEGRRRVVVRTVRMADLDA